MFSPEFQEWSNFGQADMIKLYVTYQLLLSQSVTMGPTGVPTCPSLKTIPS